MSIIDFGCAKSYIYRKRPLKGQHLPNMKQPVPVHACRNLFFASKNYFNHNTLSRRDDIIQIVYNLIYLTNPQKFPMAKIFLESRNVFDELGYYKLNFSPEEICQDERVKCFIPVLTEAYKYSYVETP